jgi:hypothetical protein
MCAACIEYTKDRLTTKEFQSALRETTMENKRHQADVERLIRENGSNPDELKKKLQELEKDR